jgi:hypothetical protein
MTALAFSAFKRQSSQKNQVSGLLVICYDIKISKRARDAFYYQARCEQYIPIELLQSFHIILSDAQSFL